MLILASASPRRRELLALITPDFTVCVSDTDEAAIYADNPAALAESTAFAKCAAVAALHTQDTIIGCDTVVDVDGVVFGKPKDAQDARRMLRVLQGRAHCVHTGVAIYHKGAYRRFTVSSQVHFMPIPDAALTPYLATAEPYDKAGAYGIQGWAAKYTQSINGCYFNIMGFPVSRIYAELQDVLCTNC
ncbi:MAG: septum formation protein Maf [Oscillospiraceae bacterium]|nr:septum formation protein Maf [Oscillospiraceae bacterium]